VSEEKKNAKPLTHTHSPARVVVDQEIASECCNLPDGCRASTAGADEI